MVFIFQLTDTFCRKVAIKIISIRYIGLIIALYCDISTYMIVGGSALVIDKENIYFWLTDPNSASSYFLFSSEISKHSYTEHYSIQFILVITNVKMSHWFHRNPLKATGFQNFEVKMFAHDSEALKIISDLKQSRARLIELLPDPHHTIEQMETALKLYMALLRGFLLQPGILVSLRSTFLFLKVFQSFLPILASMPT